MGIGSTAPRAGVCENRSRSKCSSAPWLQFTWKETDGVAGALHEIVLSVQVKLKEGCSVSHSRALTGEVLSVLVTGAGSESSCGIYTLGQGGIFFSL